MSIHLGESLQGTLALIQPMHHQLMQHSMSPGQGGRPHSAASASRQSMQDALKPAQGQPGAHDNIAGGPYCSEDFLACRIGCHKESHPATLLVIGHAHACL